MPKNKDIIGEALLDYYQILQLDNVDNAIDILTWTNISHKDRLPLSYLFRSYNKMPEIEQIALQLCYGRILDVGCGAGNHSLYLQDKGFDVIGIDQSLGAIKTSRLRGLQHTKHLDLLQVKGQFDTILLLMNGTGIFQTYNQVPLYLNTLKSLLMPDGQILIDSTDISYMYDDGDFSINKNEYFGELDYFISYKGEEEIPMKWLYLDFESLFQFCESLHLNCTKIFEDDDESYLAKISFKS